MIPFEIILKFWVIYGILFYYCVYYDFTNEGDDLVFDSSDYFIFDKIVYLSSYYYCYY